MFGAQCDTKGVVAYLKVTILLRQAGKPFQCPFIVGIGVADADGKGDAIALLWAESVLRFQLFPKSRGVYWCPNGAVLEGAEDNHAVDFGIFLKHLVTQ